MARPQLNPSGIGEYIHFESCPRYFKLRFGGEEKEKEDRVWGEAFKPLSPLLYGAGESLEEKVWKKLRKQALADYDFSDLDVNELGWNRAWAESRHRLRKAAQIAIGNNETKPILLYQPLLKGKLGVWHVGGRADLVVIWPGKGNEIRVAVFEVKASWKERTYHWIQATIYAMLLEEALKDLNLSGEVEAGVIYRKSKDLSLESLKTFDATPLREDAHRLMGKDGELDRIHHSDLSKVNYQLSWKCENCIYNENCFARSIEGESISLLNLSRGEQKVLHKHGIKTLEDLAGLKKVLPTRDQVPYNFKSPPAIKPGKVEELTSESAIGSNLDHIIQRAQFMLHGIKPGHKFANERATPPWITGTGNGRLPEDEPPQDWGIELGFKRGGLIRVYVHVEWDYMLDRVAMISARVNCSAYDGEPVSISKVADELPDNPRKSLDAEERLLKDFFTDLFDGIQHVARRVGSPDEAPIHLYFYTKPERDRLMDAVRRQPAILSAKAVRDLLGLRQAIDQPMASIVQDEVTERKGLKYPSPGLLPVLEQSYRPEKGWFDKSEWIVECEDGTSINLRKVFYHGFFNYASPFRRESDGSIRFLFEKGAFRRPEVEDYYPVRARFGSQIPLEYIWAAEGKLTPEGGPAEREVIEKCMWHDHQRKKHRITKEDLKLLGSKLCEALEHIERSLKIRNVHLGKKPIDVPSIEEFTLGKAELDRACKEYLDLEYFSRRQELYRHYALSPRQRIETGRAAVFQCIDIEEEDGLEIKGKLLYGEMGVKNPDQVANACRIKGSDGLSSGDWMVATEVEMDENGQLREVGRRTPRQIERSPRVIVEHINPRSQEITVSVLDWPSGGKYCVWHDLPTTDPTEAQEKGYVQLFERGRLYILDELADDIVAERAREALDHSEHNSLYKVLDEFLTGREPNSLQTLKLSRNPVRDLSSWLRSGYTTHPNSEQQKFVEGVCSQTPVHVLHGPPGTGKTEALAWAVLARVLAHKKKREMCRVLMVCPTHKAIHEFVDKLARCWKSYSEYGDRQLEDFKIIRIIGKDMLAFDEIEGVRYVNYHEDEDDVREIRNHLYGQVRLKMFEKFENRSTSPIIICATPAGVYGLMKKVAGGELPWENSFFDLLAVDEVSMMRLPDLMLSGAFIRKDAKVLMAGDHRQLPPIQVHNWKKEDRRIIEEIAPFLSAQNFLRLLRGEDLDLEYVKQPKNVSIPMVRLERTYRCHRTVAEFLSRWVYKRKDGVDFRSDLEHTMELVDAPTRGLKTALNPNNALVLILHDETESYQSNPVEAEIARSLVRGVSGEEIGVVTPHNAQRGLLRSELGRYVDRVDTVERFQGGQSDFIIISAAVSDPDYVRAESDFLLNLNRLNVAMSRMKKKLVVIASRSIFEHAPREAKDYEEAILWRGLLQEVGATSGRSPDWRGSLEEFLGKTSEHSSVEVKVFAS